MSGSNRDARYESYEASAATMSPAGSCNNALRETPSLCSVMYFEYVRSIIATLVLCSDATSLIGTFRSSMRTMLECRRQYIVTSAGSSPMAVTALSTWR